MSNYQPSFFDEAERLAKLTKLKDPLVALSQHIAFEIFRPQLATVFNQDRKSAAGRKAADVVLMFKLLMLQRLENLSDEQAEFQINRPAIVPALFAVAAGLSGAGFFHRVALSGKP